MGRALCTGRVWGIEAMTCTEAETELVSLGWKLLDARSLHSKSQEWSPRK